MFRVSPACIQDRTTCMYPKYPQPWIQFKEFSSACEKFIKFSQFAGKTIACLRTLYFLFEVRRARGIKNKNRGGFVDSQRKGASPVAKPHILTGRAGGRRKYFSLSPFALAYVFEKNGKKTETGYGNKKVRAKLVEDRDW